MIERLKNILLSWSGTPYRPNHNRKGVGVDCIRFVDSVLQELHNINHPDLPLYPTDASCHEDSCFARIALLMKKRFPLEKQNIDDDFRPGDVFNVRAKLRGVVRLPRPGHVVLLGHDHMIWHAIPDSGVSRCQPEDLEIVGCWRPTILC